MLIIFSQQQEGVIKHSYNLKPFIPRALHYIIGIQQTLLSRVTYDVKRNSHVEEQ